MPPTVGFRPYRMQVLGNYWPEFKNPPTDRFIADHQSALSQKILDIPIAQREPEVEPDSMSDDVRWQSVAGVVGWLLHTNHHTASPARYPHLTPPAATRRTL